MEGRPEHPRCARVTALLILLFASGVSCGEPTSGPEPDLPTDRKDAPRTVDRIPLEPGALAGRNLLLVTLDTVRADRIGCYGHGAAQTPRIDALARDGVRFERAFTTAPSTLPGHASLLTGLYPYGHGARVNGSYRVDESVTTLAESLAAAGYECGAFVAAYVLDARFGLAQGFDTYDDDLSQGAVGAGFGFRERPADRIVAACLEWLDARTEPDAPFFAWVHLFDAHAPYAPPEPFATRFADEPYDGEIAFVDAQLGRLVDGVAARAGGDATLIVVTADHGESLGEHGELQHSLFLYDATMHVPLVMGLPHGSARGLVIERPVSLVDLVPTLVALLGVGAPAELHGTSLLEPERPADLYMETLATLVQHGWSPLFALRRADAKYIDAPRPELYDLAADPRELHDRIGDEPERARALRAALDRHRERDSGRAPTLEVDAAAARELAALGYVATAEESDAHEDERRDPKDMVPVFERAQQALAWIRIGRASEGFAALARCLEDSPEDRWLLERATSAALERGQLERARDWARRGVALAPEDPQPRLRLAEVHWSAGELERAEALAHEVLEREPRHARTEALLGAVCADRGDDAAAIAWFERALEHDPGNVGADASAAIGTLRARAGDVEGARRAWEVALEHDHGHGLANASLARLSLERGDEAAALPRLETAVRAMPEDAPLLELLGGVRRRRGDLEGAARALERAVALEPRALGALRKLARVRAEQGDEEAAAQLCERILALDPDHLPSLSTLAAHHAGQGRHGEARRHLDHALRLAPDTATLHAQLGGVLGALGEVDAAREHLERARVLDPALAPRLEEALRALRETRGP